MALSECPECTFHLTVNPDWVEGAQFTCPDCGALLVITSLTPLQIDPVRE